MYKARDDVQLKQLAYEKGPSASKDERPPFHIAGDVTKKISELKGQEKGNNERFCIII